MIRQFQLLCQYGPRVWFLVTLRDVWQIVIFRNYYRAWRIPRRHRSKASGHHENRDRVSGRSDEAPTIGTQKPERVPDSIAHWAPPEWAALDSPRPTDHRMPVLQACARMPGEGACNSPHSSVCDLR